MTLRAERAENFDIFLTFAPPPPHPKNESTPLKGIYIGAPRALIILYICGRAPAKVVVKYVHIFSEPEDYIKKRK